MTLSTWLYIHALASIHAASINIVMYSACLYIKLFNITDIMLFKINICKLYIMIVNHDINIMIYVELYIMLLS